MSLIVAFSVAPASPDEDGSYAEAVSAAIRVIRDSGLRNETNAMFTNIEGEWDEVMAVIKDATMAIAAVSPRVSFVLKADLREGVTGAMVSKVASVEGRLS